MGSRALLNLEPENSEASTYSLPGNTNLRFSYSVESDAIGNITHIDGIEIEWDGRRAVAVQQGDNTITYEYNIDGQRTKKTVNGVTTEYFYNGDILAGQKTGNDTIIFMYDNNGDIFGFEYNGTPYYYLKNAQNDVVMVFNSYDRTAVVYQYDAWGNITDVYDSTTQRVSNINPITYRSYYYDIEMGVYYLNSRYYVPIICRFLSADSYVQTGQGMLDKNMFAYCGNNPVNYVDPSGTSYFLALLATFAPEIFIGCALVIIAVVGYSILLQPQVQQGISTGISSPVGILDNTFEDTNSDAEVKERDITLNKPKSQKKETFPINPYSFTPKGLIMTEYPGTKNGRIIVWKDPVTGIKVFEWDEDLKNGAHYHTMLIEWDGNHYGKHYHAGDFVPEPWNSVYFGG